MKHSKVLSPEQDRVKAIANFYDFDLNESMEKKSQDRSLVEEKDLVSKRLKETILLNEQPSKFVCIFFVRLKAKTKKFRIYDFYLKKT